jgi:hypothetical protein
MEEREEEEDRLTSAIKTRMLLPTELIQLTTFIDALPSHEVKPT